MKRILLLFLCLAISVVCFGQDKPAPRSTAAEIPPGPSMEETKAWIEREIPILGSDAYVITDGRIPLTTKYEIESVRLSDCRLTLRTAFQVNDGSRRSSTTMVSLRDVDVDALLPYRAPPPAGSWTENKPNMSVRFRAIPGHGEPFTFEQGNLHERTEQASLHIRDDGAATKAIEFFRRATVLCAALPPSPAIAKMTNGDVVQLVTAHLSDQVITTSIRNAPARDFDLTPIGLIALKKAGVSDALILVMQEPGASVDDTVWTSAAARRAGAAAGRTALAASAPGKYFNHDDNRDYVELNTDGTFQLKEGKKSYHGTYTVNGSSVTFVAEGPSGTYLSSPAGKRNLLVAPDGAVPVKHPGIKAGSTTLVDSQSQTFWEKQPGSAHDPSTMSTNQTPASVAPSPPNGCEGIESMGLYKNTVMDPAIGGGLVEWLAKIRNNTNVTKIVVFGWIDMYGEQKNAQVQIRGGEIATSRLDLTQARVIPPVRDLRVLSCQ